MGHAVEARPSGPLEVSIPAYRSDILHSHDLMEDVAIAYGYHNITPTLVPTMTVGRPHPMQQTADLVRQTLVGLGYWEVMTLNMTSPKKAFDDMHLESDPRSVILENPISTEQTQLRVSLLPGLLETLGANTHRELPQKLFEVGPISVLDETGETGAVERLQAAAVLIDARAGSAEARALVQAFVHELDIDATIQNTSRGNYLEGRCGQIRVGGTVCGHLGEIHPVVLENFGLAHPVIAFEIDLLAADVVEQRD
jgi:phenylalanyl-tRNA synthetase beta chain